MSLFYKIAVPFNKPWSQVSESDMARYLYPTLSPRQQYYARLLAERSTKPLTDLIPIAQEARNAFPDFEVFPNESYMFENVVNLTVEERSLNHFWFSQMTKGCYDPLLKQYDIAMEDVCENLDFRGIKVDDAWDPYLPSYAKLLKAPSIPQEKKQCVIM
jgi:hypothetical protein